jgi:hypothetical protein
MRAFERYSIWLFWIGTVALLISSSALSPLDYDELLHMHASWSLHSGLIPYTEFQAHHPPFFWMAASPIVGLLPTAFESFVFLRWLNLIFSFGILVGLWLIIRSFLNNIVANLSLALMLIQPYVVQTLCEIRPDALANAMIVAAAALLWCGARSWKKVFATGFLLATGCLINPKISLLAGSLFLFSLPIQIFPIIGGACLALALMTFLCALKRISIPLLIQSVFVYHGRIADASPSAALSLDLKISLWLCVGLGVLGLFLHTKKVSWPRSRRFASISLYGILQLTSLFLVSRQYLYMIFLASAVPLAFLVERGLDSRFRRSVFGAAILILGVCAARERTRWTQESELYPLKKQIIFGDALLAMTSPSDTVAALLPFHPVFRQDAAYVWCETAIRPGYSTEDVMMSLPRLKDFFSSSAIDQRLAESNPGLIVVRPLSAMRNFTSSIQRFVNQKPPGTYQKKLMGNVEMYFRIRPEPETPSPREKEARRAA